jgi:simple sugar transport system ATP-binding protein
MNEGAIVGEHKNQNVDLGALVADISGAQSTDTGTHP